MGDWPVEEIPDEDDLFCRVHRTFLRGGTELRPAIFRVQSGCVSTDWSAYSSPKHCRKRARKPEENGVVTLLAGKVRACSPLAVAHTPDQQQDNRSHSDIMNIPEEGPEKEEARDHLLQVAMEAGGWTIHPNTPTEDPES